MGDWAVLAVVPAVGSAAALTLWLLLRSGWAHRLALDEPNGRSLHSVPTPRVGGLAALPLALAAILLAAPAARAPAAIALLLGALSWFDDRRGLPVRLRLAAQLMAAGLAVGLLAKSGWPSWLLVAAVLGVVWLTNLYNFMDGANGLAGGMAVFGFGSYGVAAVGTGDVDLALASFALAGGGIGFLAFNLKPARVFLGDAGSIPLGFLAGTLGLQGIVAGIWPLWFPGLVFLPFIADATVTLVRRGLRGVPVWQAHREHAYQKLVRMGWSHVRLAAYSYVLMVAGGASALLLRAAAGPAQWLGLVAWALVYAVIFVAVERRWRRFKEKVS